MDTRVHDCEPSRPRKRIKPSKGMRIKHSKGSSGSTSAGRKIEANPIHPKIETSQSATGTFRRSESETGGFQMFRPKRTTLISGLVMASVAVALGPATVNAQSLAATSVPDGIVSGQPQISIPKDAAAKMANLDVPAGRPVDATRATTALGEYWTPERMANAIPADTPSIDIGALTQRSSPALESRQSAVDGLAERTVNALDLAAPVADVQPVPAPGNTVIPAPANGRVYFTNSDGVNMWCSGAAVNSPSKNLVATAAHCVHGGQGKGFATNWQFMPNYLLGSSMGIFQAKKFYVLDDWTTTPTAPMTAEAIDRDIAFVATFNDLLAGGQRLVDRVGGHGLRTSGPLAFSANIFGYPSNAIGGGLVGSRCTVTTNELPMSGYAFPKAACNFNNAGSGSPWLADMSSRGYGYIRTVSSANDNDGSPFIIGPDLDSRAMALYQTANSGL
ncbi:hypothetical protein M2284_004693 [Rhodococcus sp. LBL1]|nr:hypothetical protein [Rhodococcus sp. LBL1]MDH6685893.1 hypothetical protein [Rhodococcus sp. LBL2]